jgi:hypothetical protein
VFVSYVVVVVRIRERFLVKILVKACDNGVLGCDGDDYGGDVIKSRCLRKCVSEE